MRTKVFYIPDPSDWSSRESITAKWRQPIVAVWPRRQLLAPSSGEIVDIVSKIDGSDEVEGIAVVDCSACFVATHKKPS